MSHGSQIPRQEQLEGQASLFFWREGKKIATLPLVKRSVAVFFSGEKEREDEKGRYEKAGDFTDANRDLYLGCVSQKYQILRTYIVQVLFYVCGLYTALNFFCWVSPTNNELP